MQNDQKASTARHIDLSNCKLLSTYGRNPADAAKETGVKVGGLVKPLLLSKQGVLTKQGILTKIGLLIKTGLINKPGSR
jgi:hypothetical protein